MPLVVHRVFNQALVPLRLSHVPPRCLKDVCTGTQSFILLRSSPAGPETTGMKSVVCSPALRAVWSPCSVSLAHGLLECFILRLFLSYLSHGPPKGRPPPIMLCVSACDVHVHGDFLAVILHASGRIRLPGGQGPGSGLLCTRADAPCGFLVTWPAVPHLPTENTHMWPRSDASWVVLGRTPTLRAEAAALSDRRSR